MVGPLRRLTALLAIAFATPSVGLALPGYHDQRPAATLLVPFFETGVDPAARPDDTLLSVVNRADVPRTVHVHVYDRDGRPVFFLNQVIAAHAVWSRAMRDLLAVTTAAARTALRVDDVYRGFLTIDTISTSATSQTPWSAGFPFFNSNDLEGYVYFTRLSQGSANGLSMVPIEVALASTLPSTLRGFYRSGDPRERIDVDARVCAERMVASEQCEPDVNGLVLRLHNRFFGSVSLGGRSRVVAFTWLPGFVGGPSVWCGEVSSRNCATSYGWRNFDASGAARVSTMLELPHAVNVLDVQLPFSGVASLQQVPSMGRRMQVYTFAFNSAAPQSNPNLSWDAIFEGWVDP